MASTTQQEGAVVVSGAEVRYQVAGAADGRPTIVLVHGTTGSVARHFAYLFPMLGYHHRVVGIDLADTAGTLSVDTLVEQVAAVIDAAVPEGPVTLVGYSLGAVIAAAAAARPGAKIENLVLVAGWMKTDNQQAFRNRVWQRLCGEQSSALKEFMIFCAFSPSFMALRTVDDVAAIAAGLEITPFVERQMDLNGRIDISGVLPDVRARTLVVACTQDLMVPVHHSKALFGAIDDARYTEINCGHAVVHERPAELFRLINGFSADPSAYAAGTIIPAHEP